MLVKTLAEVSRFAGQMVALKVVESDGVVFSSYVGVMEKRMRLFESGLGYDIDVSGDNGTISFYTLTKYLLEEYDVTLELIV